MTYCVRYRWRATGQEFSRGFATALERTAFVVNFERKGLGTVLQEWES